MIFFKRNSVKRLQKAYENKLLEARDAQRNGKIQEYAILMDQANDLLKDMESFAQAKA